MLRPNSFCVSDCDSSPTVALVRNQRNCGTANSVTFMRPAGSVVPRPTPTGTTIWFMSTGVPRMSLLKLEYETPTVGHAERRDDCVSS